MTVLHSRLSECVVRYVVCMQVYYVAKKCSQRCSAEEYAIELAKHFVTEYPLVKPGVFRTGMICVFRTSLISQLVLTGESGQGLGRRSTLEACACPRSAA